MKLVLKYVCECNDYDETVYEAVYNKDEGVSFSVSDLSECPEDACIGRDLFDAHDFIKTLKLGMELANKGFTEIELEQLEDWKSENID